jgi:hypothetical protein
MKQGIEMGQPHFHVLRLHCLNEEPPMLGAHCEEMLYTHHHSLLKRNKIQVLVVI